MKHVAPVRSLDRYSAVVLGTPFYIGSMLGEARRFLNQHRSALASMPVAVFALGPVSRDDDLEQAQAQLDRSLAKLSWLRPVAAAMFVGRYDPARLRLADRLIAVLPASPLHGIQAHDDRDWEAIRAWAESLPAAMLPAGAED